jgi:hypothetical protein
MLNPAFVSQFKSSPALREMESVFSYTGNPKVVPNQLRPKLTLRGQQLDLTNEQLSAYQQDVGSLIFTGYTRLAMSPKFAGGPADAKASAMIAVSNAAAEIGSAGAFPYTRGVQETMYRGRLWTMRQYAGFSTARESNERYRYLLEQGQTGLSVAFDLPTQMGYDSDAPEAEGEVGRVGVAIDSIADMETLFQGIPLDKVSTSMTINSTAPILLALYVFMADAIRVANQGVDVVRNVLPVQFNWPLFCIALLLMAAPVIQLCRRATERTKLLSVE